ncbi:acyltransferase [Roseibium sp.]|uniref:acyltransferase family protein n=1 Tax=Roseibium sp. TaxID=1936156 RepID=UPI0032638D60
MLVQLQYVRAIAALLVVYFHSVLQYGRFEPEAVSSTFLFGETGVDLFFVLSGFVMWLTTADRETGPIEFYRRRIERIVPLYWLFTLSAAAIALVMPSYLKSTTFDLPHLLASLVFVPWTNPADGSGQLIAPVVIPGWTLNYEMFFYLIFGALLLLPKAVRIHALAAALLALFAVFQLWPGDGVIARFYGNPIVFEFLAGVIIARLYLAGRLMPSRLAVALVPLAFACLVAADGLDLPLPRIVSAGVPAALAIYALVSLDFSRFRDVKLLHAMGDASYSLYLSHVFTLVAVRIAYGMVPFDWLKNEILFISVCMVASVIVSLLIYRYFELPVARIFNGRRRGQRPAMAAGGERV